MRACPLHMCFLEAFESCCLQAEIPQTVSRLLMMAASVDRLQAMRRPIQYFKANKTRRAIAANALAYSLSLLLVIGGYAWSFQRHRFHTSLHFAHSATSPVCDVYTAGSLTRRSGPLAAFYVGPNCTAMRYYSVCTDNCDVILDETSRRFVMWGDRSGLRWRSVPSSVPACSLPQTRAAVNRYQILCHMGRQPGRSSHIRISVLHILLDVLLTILSALVATTLCRHNKVIKNLVHVQASLIGSISKIQCAA